MTRDDLQNEMMDAAFDPNLVGKVLDAVDRYVAERERKLVGLALEMIDKRVLVRVPGHPCEYPMGSPTADDVLAEFERSANERD